MNYGSIKYCDTANGPGLRTSVFVSGCPHHCKGCFNEATWDYDYGKPYTLITFKYILDSLKEPNIQGLSILGGEPLDPKNQEYVWDMVMAVNHYNQFHQDNRRDIWLYTGYTWETIPTVTKTYGNTTINITKELLSRVDVVVDGPFIEAEKDISLQFRGSRNQRIIDVQKTLKEGEVIIFGSYRTVF